MRGRVGGVPNRNESAFTRAVNGVFAFFRLAEFEILFFLFIFIAFLIFKDLAWRKKNLELERMFLVLFVSPILKNGETGQTDIKTGVQSDSWKEAKW
ncbi:uncharacterized protein LOC122072065 [Macadamia integrifolia]|uniref:uncharacterized protein LOC122072065 n=1 Tax=Macadamia integrifolia TaxID=60698 RepID=UPI001C4F4A31|nr:uncharacterized protein LOC122072065 [Macadamia integrifolia]